MKSLALLILMAVASIAAAKNHEHPGLIPGGCKVFIPAMQGNLDGFIAAEIIKLKVPVVIVTDESSADYILTGLSLNLDNHWYNFAFGGKDAHEGNVELVSVKDKRLVWAGEAGDRSLWYGAFRRGGQRKIADRIVRRKKNEVFGLEN